MLAIRDNYEKQLKSAEARMDKMKKSLQDQAAEISSLLEDKRSDKLKIRELEGKLMILVARYVPPESQGIFGEGGALIPEINEDDLPEEADRDYDDYEGQEEAGINLEQLKTQSSGEEDLLEEAYEQHERTS